MRPRMIVGAPGSALVLALLAVGCGGATQETSTASTAPPPPAVTAIDPATAATITGTIRFDGPVPKPQVFRMSADPTCAKSHTEPTTLETLLVADDGGLQNVLVYVKDGVKGTYVAPTTPVVLDQKGCQYVPHVFALMVGQPLQIVNSDPTLHNVHALPVVNQEFNQGQPQPGMKFDHVFSAREVMMPIKCDVHGWMSARGSVLDHPFFAVSGRDGSFTITGLPPGTYTLEAIHESLGAQTTEITVAAKDAKSADFSFKPAAPTS